MGSQTCSQCFSTLVEEKLLCKWKTFLVHFDHGCSANTFFNLEVWADTKAWFPWSWLQSLVRLIWYDYCWAEVWFGSQTLFFPTLFSWSPDICTSQDMLPKSKCETAPPAHWYCGRHLKITASKQVKCMYMDEAKGHGEPSPMGGLLLLVYQKSIPQLQADRRSRFHNFISASVLSCLLLTLVDVAFSLLLFFI